MASGIPNPKFAKASPKLIPLLAAQGAATLAQQHAKIEGFDHQIVAKAAERDQAKAAIAKIEASLPLVEQRVQIYEKLRENEYSSKVAMLEAQQQLVDMRNSRAVAGHQLERN